VENGRKSGECDDGGGKIGQIAWLLIVYRLIETTNANHTYMVHPYILYGHMFSGHFYFTAPLAKS